MLLLISALNAGLIFALLALGVYISFRVFNFPDITPDGSFALGGAVTTTLLVQGFDPFTATAAGLLAGLLAGAVPGLAGNAELLQEISRLRTLLYLCLTGLVVGGVMAGRSWIASHQSHNRLDATPQAQHLPAPRSRSDHG